MCGSAIMDLKNEEYLPSKYFQCSFVHSAAESTSLTMPDVNDKIENSYMTILPSSTHPSFLSPTLSSIHPDDHQNICIYINICKPISECFNVIFVSNIKLTCFDVNILS